MAALPDGLVVVGDANTSLNPIYAQGMSQGAIGASLLDASLQAQRHACGAGELRGLSARFHRRYGRFIDECWMTSTTEDYGALDARGQRAWYAPLLARYLHRFTELTWQDRAAARAFLDVMNLQRPPTSLLRPALLWKTLTGPRPVPVTTTPVPASPSP
jgi:2-polyprenyl-6-methoxyphenol hydroxylase-like FAD-dependent oxidoreductase